MPSKKQVFVLGMDGATFDIINPMLAEGKLPNIARLMESGASGALHSTIPDLSPTAWTSFASGKHPGKHGILDFLGQNPATYNIFFYNASYRTARPMWTILSELGKKVCVLNVPFTYPPDEVNGVMVSGMDTPNTDSDFIYPPGLRRELDEKTGGYLLEPGFRDIKDKVGQYCNSIFKITENRFKAAEFLIQKDDWNLFVMVFEGTDRAQHNFWHYMDPEHPEYSEEFNKKYGRIIFDTYQDIDAKIGELMKKVPEGALRLIMSDHGFGPLYKGVRLNKWLEHNGYSTFFRSQGGILKSRLAERTKRFVNKGLHKISQGKLSSGAPRLLANFDMEKTRVYPVGGHGNFCINLKGRQASGTVEPGAEYEDLRDELIEKLKTLKDPETGGAVVADVVKREAVYPVFPENAPDLFILWNRGYYFIRENELDLFGIKADAGSLFTGHNWSGNHTPEGILIMQGDGIKKGYRITDAAIIDIAPTIMYLLDAAIPDDMDGKVLEEAIEESYVNSNRRRSTKVSGDGDKKDTSPEGYSKEEEEEIGDRLRALGYIE
ncbi:MAG: alkaline phosphatase family protein [Thermodesulfobacteriota bacterium]